MALLRFQIGFVWRFFWHLHPAWEALPDAVALARSVCRVYSPRGSRFQILSYVEYSMRRWKCRDFSLISTKLEMTGHTNPTRQRGFGEPYVCVNAAEPSLAPRVNIRDDWRPI